MSALHTSAVEALLVQDDFDGEVFFNEAMSKHTSYGIGGPAKFFVQVFSVRALRALSDTCAQSEIPLTVVGRGTNLLVSDDGYDGVVVTLGRDFRNFRVDAEKAVIVAGAGASLGAVVQEALRAGLTGLEFAVGTPGSIGGALRMNAGSADDWIGSRVGSVTVLDCGRKDKANYDSEGDSENKSGLRKLLGSDIKWGYRRTSFSRDEAILECELVLAKGDSFFIQGKMEGNLARRKKTQPIGKACCGSVFRNPEGASAAKLIDDLGLKGTRIGGAEVSEKHANFIINTGGAKATDVLELIELIASKVEREYGIQLTPEVRFLGF